MQRRGEDEQQRQAEFDKAVGKAKLFWRIAQADAALAPRVKQGRDEMGKAREVYSKLMAAARDDSISRPEGWFAKRVEQDFGKIRQDIDAAVAAMSGATFDWSADLQSAAKAAGTAMDGFAQAAAGQKWDTPSDAEASLKAIDDVTNALSEKLDDVGSLFTEVPLRLALDHARVAKEIALDKVQVLEAEWIKPIVAQANTQAEGLSGQEEWYKSLALYSSLADLYQDNKEYKDAVRRVSRHARVMALYGPPEKPELKAASQPSSEPFKSATGGGDDLLPSAVPPNVKWKEYVAQVDVDMIKRAISEMEGNYVETVDYRKVLNGGLQAVHVLVTTPKLAVTFPSLGDPKALAEFLQRLDGLIQANQQRDAVQSIHLGLALDSLLAANRQTLQLPAEVIDVEFTDGLMDQLDEFSSMIWPSDWPDFKKRTVGTFSGVGIQIEMDNRLLRVVSPLEGTPAYEKGIQAGDYIVGIDGHSAENIDIDEAVRQITGQENTLVTLTIKRPGRESTFPT